MAIELRVLAALGERIEWHDSLESTNDRAREIARVKGGAAHGFVVGAEEQTAGRGRKGARWVTEPGRGLAFSMVVRPPWPKERWGWLSLAAGVAVCECLEDLELGPEVKWPNDVLLSGRKVCGILIETSGEEAVVGIGLNVNEEEFPEELAAVSLRQILGRPVEREGLLLGIWEALLNLVQCVPSQIAERTWDRLAWREREVETTAGERGRIRGFGENGELSVETRERLIRISDAHGLCAVPVDGGDGLRDPGRDGLGA